MRRSFVVVLEPVMSGWSVAAGCAVVWVWSIGWSKDAAETEQLAEEERRSRSTDTWVVLAGVASLVAVVVALVQPGDSKDAEAVGAVLLSVIRALFSPNAVG